VLQSELTQGQGGLGVGRRRARRTLSPAARQAADWAVLHDRGSLTAAELVQFEIWLARPENASQYAKMNRLWARFHLLPRDLQRRIVDSLLDRVPVRSLEDLSLQLRLASGTLAGLVVVVQAFLIWRA
jgi:ferric-dicitrate binding protein FerR (iron transport regulator)